MSASEGEHDVSARSLFVTWLALMVLAGVSLALRFAHLGGLGFHIALGIAVLKAVLVALVFMELAYEKPMMRFAFVTGVTLLVIMVVFMIADVLTRPIPPLENPPGNARRYHG
jgi:cytochrome c oxidase subunit 4